MGLRRVEKYFRPYAARFCALITNYMAYKRVVIIFFAPPNECNFPQKEIVEIKSNLDNGNFYNSMLFPENQIFYQLIEAKKFP